MSHMHDVFKRVNDMIIGSNVAITKPRLYIFDPLQPHFYVVKLGFTRYTLFSLFVLKKHRLWVRGGSNEYSQSIF